MRDPKPPPSMRLRRLLAATTLLVLCAGGIDASWADTQQEFLLFGSVDTFNNVGKSNEAVEDASVRPAVDVLYSYAGDRFRLLGEYLWSSHESELERLKAGWQTGDNTMFWVGRMHSIAKYWTTEYHHGQFLQTSITRPSVEQWEDESGPMPSHVTGLSLERESIFPDNRAIDFGVLVGYAPRFIEDRLVPFDLLDPDPDHGLSANLRVAFRPQAWSLSQFGLLVGWNDINVDSGSATVLNDLDEIRQLTVSAYGDWSWERWRVIANLIYFDNDLRYVDGPVDDRFASAYLQAEFAASGDWTVFGRIESSFNEDASPYLRMLPAYIPHRHMLGARWDIANFQSLTVELAETSAQIDNLSHLNFKEIRFQWSAVFP